MTKYNDNYLFGKNLGGKFEIKKIQMDMALYIIMDMEIKKIMLNCLN